MPISETQGTKMTLL